MPGAGWSSTFVYAAVSSLSASEGHADAVKRLLFALFALACLTVAVARAQTPNLTDSNDFAVPGTLLHLRMSGQGACSVTIATNGGSAIFTPWGSSDHGATIGVVPSIGVQSTDGTYGGSPFPYLTDFWLAIDQVTGDVNAFEACSGAAGVYAPVPTPSPIPIATPTPTPSPVPTPPTPGPTATPANCPTAIASLAPVAAYSLNESSGNSVADSSGNGYTATLKNPSSTTQAVTGIGTGNLTAYSISTPSYIAIPNTLPYAKTYSVLSFVRAGTWPQFCIVNYFGSCLSINGGSLGYGHPGSGAFTQVLSLSTSIAHMVAMTADNTTTPFTVLGSVDGGTLTNLNTARLSNGPTPYSYIAQKIINQGDATPLVVDETAIFSYTLSQTQINQLATVCGVPIPTPVPTTAPTYPPGGYASAVAALHPLAYYRLDEPSGTTVTDSSGNGYTGTVTQPSRTTLGATGLLVSDADTAYNFTASPAPLSLPSMLFYRRFTIAVLANGASYSGARVFVNYFNNWCGIKNNQAAAGSSPYGFGAAGPTLTNGTSYFIVCEYSPGGGGALAEGAYVSVNGGTVVKVLGTPPGNFNALWQINSSPAANPTTFTGTLDEPAIFPYLLTQAQITALAATAGYP